MEIKKNGIVAGKEFLSQIPQTQTQVEGILNNINTGLASGLVLAEQEKQTLAICCVYLIHYTLKKNELQVENFQSIEFLQYGNDYDAWSVCYRAEDDAADSFVAGIWLHINTCTWNTMYTETRKYLEAYFYHEVTPEKVLVRLPAHCLQYLAFEHSF